MEIHRSAQVSLQEEARMPLVQNEGPTGLILCPSRELARQTYEVADVRASGPAPGSATPLPPSPPRIPRVPSASLLWQRQGEARRL